MDVKSQQEFIYKKLSKVLDYLEDPNKKRMGKALAYTIFIADIFFSQVENGLTLSDFEMQQHQRINDLLNNPMFLEKVKHSSFSKKNEAVNALAYIRDMQINNNMETPSEQVLNDTSEQLVNDVNDAVGAMLDVLLGSFIAVGTVGGLGAGMPEAAEQSPFPPQMEEEKPQSELEKIKEELENIIPEEVVEELDEEEAEKEEKLPCPCCNVEMKKVTINDILIDKCPECKGYWFDAGELTDLVKGITPTQLKSLENEKKDVSAEEMFRAYQARSCPRCELKLKETYFKASHDLVADMCDKCKGIWLDYKELTRVTLSMRRKRR